MFKTEKFEDRAFKPLSIAVIAVSDTRTLETDTGGALLKSLLEADGHRCFERQVVRDEIQLVRAADLAHRHPISAYDGRRLAGSVTHTWLRGEEPTAGRLLTREAAA